MPYENQNRRENLSQLADVLNKAADKRMDKKSAEIVPPPTAPSKLDTSRQQKEQDHFNNVYAQCKQNIEKYPLDIGVQASDYKYDLSTCMSNVDSYRARIMRQIRDKNALEKQQQEMEQARAVASQVAAQLEEEKSDNIFKVVTTIGMFLAVIIKCIAVAKAESIVGAILTTLGLDLLYGVFIGLVGKANYRSKGRCVGKAWVEVGLSMVALIIVGLAAADHQFILYACVAQIIACWLAMVCTSIARGRD